MSHRIEDLEVPLTPISICRSSFWLQPLAQRMMIDTIDIIHVEYGSSPTIPPATSRSSISLRREDVDVKTVVSPTRATLRAECCKIGRWAAKSAIQSQLLKKSETCRHVACGQGHRIDGLKLRCCSQICSLPQGLRHCEFMAHWIKDLEVAFAPTCICWGSLWMQTTANRCIIHKVNIFDVDDGTPPTIPLVIIRPLVSGCTEEIDVEAVVTLRPA
mmetsp:Transcript_62379/g.118440  ORF Transcript_62379/g.118440 Transcript_62379/m.118440 type:complete len:216 (-) Transcript_62379:184-831(-)